MPRNDPLSAVSTRVTPQSEQADERQVKNSAGGYTFTLDAEARIRRFLVLGTDGATYYASAKDLTKDNAQLVIDFAKQDGTRLTDIILEISEAGRAPKQNPTLFAYAIAVSLGGNKTEADRLDAEIAAVIAKALPAQEPEELLKLRHERAQVEVNARRYALDALPKIVRTGTHLFIFARYVKQFRGWGRGLREAVGKWYTEKSVDQLAYQAVKYRQREGWSHRDLLRKAHPSPLTPERDGLFKWIVGREVEGQLPMIVDAFEAAQASGDPTIWVKAVKDGVPWEGLPDPALGHVDAWDAMLNKGVPMTALVRQLPRLTRLGLTRSHRKLIVDQLTDAEHLRKARIHPVNVLVALRTYASGHSARGESSWSADRHIIDALDEAFYRSFDFVEPTNKRILLALDISGSMGSPISNMPLTCREAAAAIAMTLVRTEQDVDTVGFTSGNFYDRRSNQAVTELTISARQRLDDVINYTAGLPMGGTDCAAPFLWALEQKRDYDAVIVITDNESWAGRIHPHQALARYRQRTGLPTKLVAVGMTATEYSIADPSDSGSMNVAGFDSAVPTLINDFIKGF